MSILIVFKGKYIEKEDDFYLVETENLTISKSYEVIKENKMENSYTILDDNGSFYSVLAKDFWTLEEWRDIKLKELGL
jgi:hypothetical protein